MFLPKFDGQGRVTPRDEKGYRRSSLARGRCFIAVGSRRDTGDCGYHGAGPRAIWTCVEVTPRDKEDTDTPVASTGTLESTQDDSRRDTDSYSSMVPDHRRSMSCVRSAGGARALQRALERTHAENSAPELAVSSDSGVEVVGDPAVEERESAGSGERRRAIGYRAGRGTGTVGRGAEVFDGGGGSVAGPAAEGPRSGGGLMACPSAGGGGGGATSVGGTGGGLVGGSTHPQVRGRGAQSGREERGWGRALRAIPFAVAAGGATHSPLRGGVVHERSPRQRRTSLVGHAAVEAGPATHAAIRRARATGRATAIRRIDRAAAATTAREGSPPGTGGGEDGGADGGTGSARKPQHAGVRGRGRAVEAEDGGMDVARGARDGTDEGGAQDMGGGGPQSESSGSPDERPAGCVGSAYTEHGLANTGDDGNDGGGGIAGKGTWVWPEPPATQRPPLQRQTSTPGATRPRPQFMRQ
ncbi:uncharacterized PE-PGRS family protein PE_PGRS10-like, partial [Drosophila subpulchrella]|uniref:uncharacterized PE-PGRS family protein PE_PGRS10-like n=1 Tax=Drosophila subpulchrella TaxID=1486046 RepID=UPI0018A1A35D